MQMKYGIVVTIRKLILKVHHKLEFTPFGMIIIQTMIIKIVLMNKYLNVSICISMNGMK